PFDAKPSSAIDESPRNGVVSVPSLSDVQLLPLAGRAPPPTSTNRDGMETRFESVSAKCKCGVEARPVRPLDPTRCPLSTRSPGSGSTEFACRCRYNEYAPQP